MDVRQKMAMEIIDNHEIVDGGNLYSWKKFCVVNKTKNFLFFSFFYSFWKEKPKWNKGTDSLLWGMKQRVLNDRRVYKLSSQNIRVEHKYAQCD